MMRFSSLVCAFSFGLVSLLLVACSERDERRTSEQDTHTGSASDSFGQDSESDSNSGSEPWHGNTDEQCAETGFAVTGRPVDMLIVLDRSNSMQVAGLWNPMGTALETVTQATADKLFYGLMFYPSVSACDSSNSMPNGQQSCAAPALAGEVPSVEVGAVDAVEQIAALLGPDGTEGCCGGTPTAAALKVAGDYLSSLDDGHDHFVLLATDGAPNCDLDLPVEDGLSCICTFGGCFPEPYQLNCLDEQGAVDAAAALFAEGIRVYVLGIGDGAKPQWAQVMANIAEAGGTTHHYSVSKTADLVDTLSTIAGSAMSCDFDVDWESLPGGASEDPTLVNIYCKGHPSDPADETNVLGFDDGCGSGTGWTWKDESTVRLCPQACDRLKSGECVALTATFGCESVII